MLDDPRMELGYAVLVLIAWSWALSQVLYAVHYGGPWRWITAYWLVSKGVFFSVAAYIWWFNELPGTVLEYALYNLVVAHLVAFVKWLTLPKTNALAPEPPKGGPTV